MPITAGILMKERFFWFRPFGELKGFFWLMVLCNCIGPLPLWRKKIRTNLAALFVISIIVNIGMWLERFNIVVTSLCRTILCPLYGVVINLNGEKFGLLSVALVGFLLGFFCLLKSCLLCRLQN